MTKPDTAIVITAKAPEPGRVKTRLVPLLSGDEAAALHVAFLSDTLRAARAIPDAEVAILTPRGDAASVSRVIRDASIPIVEQTGAGLEAALDGLFVRFTQGGRRVVALDSDSPHLPASAIRLALDGLTQADIAVGPTLDGGYYLVGARESHPGLFRSLGTSDALTALRHRARELRLSVWTGPEDFDVDRPDDLSRLRLLLEREPWRAPETAKLLRQWPRRAPSC